MADREGVVGCWGATAGGEFVVEGLQGPWHYE